MLLAHTGSGAEAFQSLWAGSSAGLAAGLAAMGGGGGGRGGVRAQVSWPRHLRSPGQGWDRNIARPCCGGHGCRPHTAPGSLSPVARRIGSKPAREPRGCKIKRGDVRPCGVHSHGTLPSRMAGTAATPALPHSAQGQPRNECFLTPETTRITLSGACAGERG